MLDLLQNLHDDFSDNDFLAAFRDAYSKRDDKTGYFYTHADSVVVSLYESGRETMRIPEEIEAKLQKADPDKLHSKIGSILTDSLILGYLAQVFYVDRISKKVETRPLPPLDHLNEEVRDYQTSVGEYWPLNDFLDDLVNNVEKRVETATELATLGKLRSTLAKDVRNNAYTGQVIALLQGYTANTKNMKD